MALVFTRKKSGFLEGRRNFLVSAGFYQGLEKKCIECIFFIIFLLANLNLLFWCSKELSHETILISGYFIYKHCMTYYIN